MKVLVTGGAGYIGSTTAKALERAGHVPVVLDSLRTGPRAFVRDRIFYEGDVADRVLLRRIVDEHPDLGAVIHMAARIVVPESIAQPAAYYRANVSASLDLFDELDALGLHRVVFSSSAAVYAPTASFEVDESSPLAPASPYARSKRMMEEVLQDLAAASGLRAVVLRYFNPIGADPELDSGVHLPEPSHVMGRLVMAARGELDAFTITGTDLPTRDGTGLRDFVHVWDLAEAHVRAVERFDELVDDSRPSVVINLGTGAGVTVRELLTAFEAVHGSPVPVREAEARPGDAVGAFANVDRAVDLLGWKARLGLEDGIDSALRWAARRPEVLGTA
ncbi:UDP-glucose 4-epimerase GalE [Aeromicrobium sp. Leaf350]|uniref:UDP-glucose 4-epimerase GalE n=1 Tax=Aeromicrobium sp. Leaf350 TaxID=2876565 RepID=UPI001E5D5F26|nr:UDP-glucose 4-epimerase GalE [Aeromicrobium sp. Leaf350]